MPMFIIYYVRPYSGLVRLPLLKSTEYMRQDPMVRGEDTSVSARDTTKPRVPSPLGHYPHGGRDIALALYCGSESPSILICSNLPS